MDSNNLVLNPEIIEKFCDSFISKLSKYKLSYYLRKKSNDKSAENAIHASIIWTRQAVTEINKSQLTKGSKQINDIIILISYIDILLESTEQIYRALYKSTNYPYDNQEEFCFRDIPDEYKQLNNKKYFKEIRALFSAHPVNIKTPSGELRFADIPIPKGNMFAVSKLKGDFNIRLWTATKNDKDTIHFTLYVEDLLKYSQVLYSRYDKYSERLIKIAKKDI